MKLTKEFRNKTYKIMLDLLIADIARRKITGVKWLKCEGLCIYFDEALRKQNIFYVLDDVNGDNAIRQIQNYLELKKHKPKHKTFIAHDYWFKNDDDGANKRIAILEQAIEETK